MPRPKIKKRITIKPKVTRFKPEKLRSEIKKTPEIELEAEEFNALILVDQNSLNQTEAAKEMKISQSTLQRILSRTRFKVARALFLGLSIKINK